MAQTQHTLKPDALAKQSKPAKIVDVKDTMTLKDDTVEVTAAATSRTRMLTA